MAEGIETRHGRACRARQGGRCNCSPTYRASVWSQRDRKRIRRSFDSHDDAKAWRQQAGTAVRAGALRPSRSTTVGEAAAQWLHGARAGTIRTRTGKPYKSGTIRNYERVLELHVPADLKRRRLADVRRVDVQDLVDELVAAGLAATTVGCAILPLRAVYRRALDRGEVAVNPTAGVNVPSVRRARDRIEIPSLDHLKRLLGALEPRDRALYATATYAGLRLGELQALTWSNVDLASGVIRVEAGWDRVDREAIEPKSEDGRRKVPVVPVLRDLLLEHRLTVGGEGYVFGRSLGEPFAPSSVYKRARRAWGWRRERIPETERYRWVPAREDALEPVKPHLCRHACASMMIAAGVNAKQLQAIMGHASIAITYDVYGHLWPDSLDEAAAALNTWLERADTAGRLAQLASRTGSERSEET